MQLLQLPNKAINLSRDDRGKPFLVCNVSYANIVINYALVGPRGGYTVQCIT